MALSAEASAASQPGECNCPACQEKKAAAAAAKKAADLKKAVTGAYAPLFYNPFGELAKAGKGTHYFAGRGYVFDQVVLSPGLLDGEGWSYVNRSAAIVEQLKFRDRPDRFGGPNDKRPWRNRGASYHFPVTVQLRVQGK